MPIYIFLICFSFSLNVQGQKTMRNIIKDHPFYNTSDTPSTFTEIIQSHSGKVLYIDFWASWCGPCKKEMPYSHKLKKQLQDLDVEFIYISIDESKAAWEKSIKKLQLDDQSSIHYRRGQKEMIDFLKYFYIYSIPHYMIVDKKGQIHNRDALPPSDPKLARQLKKLAQR